MLADEIRAAARREAIAKLDAGELELKKLVIAEIGEPLVELNHGERELLSRWASWCEAAGVRRCPAKSWVVARWITINKNSSPGSIVAMLDAVERLHFLNSLASPVRGPIVARAMEQIFPEIEPPRSWTRQEKDGFATLDPLTQNAISRRMKECEHEIRRLQNSIADERKRLTNGAEKKSVAQTKEELQNG
jgi:hypothetical protein